MYKKEEKKKKKRFVLNAVFFWNRTKRNIGKRFKKKSKLDNT